MNYLEVEAGRGLRAAAAFYEQGGVKPEPKPRTRASLTILVDGDRDAAREIVDRLAADPLVLAVDSTDTLYRLEQMAHEWGIAREMLDEIYGHVFQQRRKRWWRR